MRFYSTNRKSDAVDFRNGVVRSLPSDNGLYFPESIPDIKGVYTASNLDLHTLGFEILRPFCAGIIPDSKLAEIVEDTLAFDIPVVPVAGGISALELFHGPTYAFKDVGARFLARCLGYFHENEDKEVTILVATSGDTGGAVASGFLGVDGVSVIILYPSGKVSELQEKQLTTQGQNIKALEIDGTFDDCQDLVKKAFLDEELNKALNLSSANSINIARWIPQSIYHGWASLQVEKLNTVAVPSGNYGNLAAGILAKKMGAPIQSFVAATNANDVVPRYLESGSYEPRPTISTYANAMDVGKPSNFPRLLALYDSDFKALKLDIAGFSMSDDEILETIHNCWQQNQYLLDPHGAIGFKSLANRSGNNLFLETAHPCKFDDVIRKVRSDYELPGFTSELMGKEKEATPMNAKFDLFKDYLLQS